MTACPLLTVWGLLGVPDGWLRQEWEDGRVAQSVRCEEPERFLALLAEGPANLYLSPARRSAVSSLTRPVPFLAVVSVSRASERILGGFRPKPTLVLREGATARLTCLWALNAPLPATWAEEANRRLAHRARAPKKLCHPDVLRFRAPGSTYGREGRPVVVEHLDPTALYSARDVVARLPASPDRDAWRKRAV